MLGVLSLSACALGPAKAPRSATPLADSLQELVPHADRDHLVYLWERSANGQVIGHGLQVEHLTAIGEGGEFEVTLSEDGVVVGHTNFRDDGHALLLLSEDVGNNFRLSYDPPLPQVEVPLLPGEHRTAGMAHLIRLDTGLPVGSIDVLQVTRASAAPPVRSPLGSFEHAVLMQTTRSLKFPQSTVDLSSTMLLVPGIGEIRSDGTASGTASLHRELACARIADRSLGDCKHLKDRLEEMDRAGSTDLH